MKNTEKRDFFKKTLHLCICLWLVVSAQIMTGIAYGQTVHLTVQKENVTVKEVLSFIEKNSKFVFFYVDKNVDLLRKVSLNVIDQPITKVLEELFKNTSNSFRIEGNQIYITKKETNVVKEKVIDEKAKKIKGTVTDEKNQPVIGGTVLLDGTTSGNITDINGNFSFEIPHDGMLKITYLGYKPQFIATKDKTVFDVSLVPSNENLGEVVVIGYGTQKKESLTASISSVLGAELVKAPVTNISDAMKGQLAGLIAIQNSGQPGNNSASLLIRGIGTFTGNTSPLIMVDGIARDTYNDIDPNEIASISILKDASATAVYGVRGANGVILITTKRGNEGTPKVSLSQQMAYTSFTNLPKTVNAYQYATLWNEVGFENYWTEYGGQYTNWDAFVQARNANWTSSTLYYSPQQLTYFQNAHTPTINGQSNPNYNPYFYPDVDWQSLMFKQYTPQSQGNLNISGGTKFVKYFLSLGYLNEGGLFKTDYMRFPNQMNFSKQRYNIRGNFDFDVTKDLKISVEIATQFINLSGMGTNTNYIWQKVILWTDPTSSPGMINGKYVVPFYNQQGGKNSMYTLESTNNYLLQKNSILNSAVKATYLLDCITKGLSINGKASYDSYFSSAAGGQYAPLLYGMIPNPNGDNLNPVLAQLNSPSIPNVWGDYYNGKWRNEYEELSFNYDRTFGKSHITALALASAEKRYDPNLQYDLPHAYQAFVGRATYAWDEKYFAEYDMGYNGSENFAPGKRFGYFPSYSAGWILSQEKFFPKNDAVTFVKFRGSYGSVGNDNIYMPGTSTSARYLYLPDSWQYSTGTWNGYTFGSLNQKYKVNGASEATLGNPDVTWEVSKNLDLSLELHFWKNKISLTYDYYKNHRNNILAYMQTVPAIVAASLPPYNIGSMDSWGHEFELSYNNHAGKFNYFVKANVSFNDNKIINMDEAILPSLQYQAQTGHPYGQQLLLQADGLYTSWSQLYAIDSNGNPILSEPVLAKNSKGQPYNNPATGLPVYQKDLGYAGVLPQPGEVRLKDINEDGVIDNNDRVRAGNTGTPKLTYGVTLGFNVAGFDFSSLFAGASGVAALGMNPADPHFTYGHALFAVDLDRFSPERYAAGDKIVFPMAGYNQQAYPNSFFLINTEYMRLQNLSIGYTIQKNFLKKIGLESVRIYVSGNNLYTWSPNKIWGDPENLGLMTYPLTKTYNTGINVNF